MSSLLRFFPCLCPKTEEDPVAFFHLQNIPATFQIQVLRKVDWKSYFRMQQTCKYFKEMVEENRTITGISLPPSIIHDRKLNRICYAFDNWKVEIGSRLSYGLKFDTFHIDGDTFKELGFEGFCQSIKYGRYSCKTVKIYDSPGKTNLTKEQCIEILNILGPTAVYIDCISHSNNYEAIFHCKGIKAVNIWATVGANVVEQLLQDCLSCFDSVSLRLFGELSYNDICDVCSIVKFLRSHVAVNLQEFSLILNYNGSDVLYSQLSAAFFKMRPRMSYFENMGRYQDISAWEFSNRHLNRNVALDPRRVMVWSHAKS